MLVLNFFASLEKGFIHLSKFRTREQTKMEICKYIEVSYYNSGLHSSTHR
ncbi:MAG: IS3 family transposase [Flexilinea sp.]